MKDYTDPDQAIYKIDGYDEAIIGLDQSIEPRLVYDIDKIIEIMVTTEGLSEEDAHDHMSYNITSQHIILVKLGKLKDLL
tara:strand:- start:310 stop:549 length:240 start_codon:yes stop_codon:yes gene_type:complete